MGNLTQEERLVSEERSGFSPKPGHDIVVFELVDRGLRNPEVVPEAKTFEPRRKGLFSKAQEYVSYAVSNNKHFRYSFTNRFNHKSVAHSFDLTFNLRFAVNEADLLVAKLQSDPLRQVRDEAQRLVGAEVTTYSWEEIVASKLKDNSKAISEKATTAVCPELTTFAKDFGIDLRDVSIVLNLTSDDAAPLLAESNLSLKSKVAEIEQRSETGQITRELQLGIERQKLAEQKQIHENEILLLKQKAAVQGGALDAVTRAFGNIGAETRTPEALLHGVDAVVRTFGTMNPNASIRTGLSSGLQPAPGLLGAGGQDGLEGLIKDALLHFGPYTGKPENKNMLANILHWIVENYLGKTADDKLLEYYYDRLSESIKTADLSGEPYFFINRVLDKKELTQRLFPA